MIAFKLFKLRKDGSIGSLFINSSARLPKNEWILAQSFPTKGFKVRPFWHCTAKPEAPHLSMKGRAWFRVRISNFEKFNRPKSQGSEWFLAKRIKILEKVS